MDHLSAAGPAPITHTKQYVFVDEYNRHKRLKVMRACDGCRKRKIRCDGALQNGPWPCGACVRLKLKCVPPSLDQDNDSGSDTPDSASSQTQFHFPPTSAFTSHPRTTATPSQSSFSWAGSGSAATPITTNTAPTSAPSQQGESTLFPSFVPQQRPQMNAQFESYREDDYYNNNSQYTQATASLPALDRTQTATSESCGDPEEVEHAVKELSSHMGDLSVGVTAVAPYIADHHKHSADMPALEETILPPDMFNDPTVRIPREMMPHDDRAMDYFNYFFDYIHPYVPVLNKAAFYEQWALDRDSMSPLLLEAIFACATQYLDPSTETKKWLALAARHEESFKDVPRLSTVQALIILMKAREFSQKPGYYYRSWMALKYLTTMAIDLGLNEHPEKHKGSAIACKIDPADCLVRTRVWQTLFILELLIGGPQGRTDMNVDEDSVEMSIPFPAADLDAFEYQTSRRCTVLAQSVRNINHSLQIMIRKRKTNPKDWCLDPEYAAYDEKMAAYIKDLPSDLQLHYPEDGSAPWLGGDHFVANLHIYYHLVVMQHHRPQLQAKLEKRDPTFKQHLDICAQSAALMCRNHEALYRDFGLHGLLFMLRGINFTVYSILTCTMLHLVAITSPDPALNSQARDYFSRHMRILEHCIPTASPEMQTQINSLREAFSLDTSRPFELKPTLGGMRSPSVEKQLTPPLSQQSTPGNTSADTWQLQAAQSMPAASPLSEYGNRFASGSVPNAVTSHPTLAYSQDAYSLPTTSGFSAQQRYQPTTSLSNDQSYGLEPISSNELPTPHWDPSGIFSQWHTAFGTPIQAPASSPPAGEPRMLPGHSMGHTSAGPTSVPMLGVQQRSPPAQAMYGTPVSPTVQSALPNDVSGPGMPSIPTAPTVTSMMWQDAFTNAYISGHKRYREGSIDGGMYNGYAAKRRG
ncbi:hypothetical protein AMS68_001989 [Peltaster fructicola]|uniref:Zn(2)-C6 fungal-type domain-containing protein n=1 Tax=Peltaster fructicola TaxID=286661 RepID=A0A6H0XNY5_9PEZI|nr:hypothetical protein AMS68_001989 [Peltaster fructicola]